MFSFSFEMLEEKKKYKISQTPPNFKLVEIKYKADNYNRLYSHLQQFFFIEELPL